MRDIVALTLLALLSTSSTAAAIAGDDPGYTPGPWHYRSVACVDTTVNFVGPRLSDASQSTKSPDFRSGVAIGFNTGLGLAPIFAKDRAGVVHYADSPGNTEMQAEKVGDRVQVCFLGGPAPTVGCDPDTDDRGRNYRVWDYARKAQFNGFNAEHLCGGA